MENNTLYRKDGQTVYIKQPSFSELDYVNELWSDSETTAILGGPFHLPEEKREAFYEKMVLKTEGLNFFCLIYNKEDKAVGEVSFGRYDKEKRSAEFNIKIQAKHRGRGYAREAVELMLDYYFNEFGGEVMEDDIVPENQGAHMILQKCGFKHVETEEKEACLYVIDKTSFNNK